jgi:predicted P-loop ATPase
MVAQWIGRNRNYGNSVAPLLISKQGFNKSTFCKSLIPEELQWGYNDSLVLSEKKAVLQAMSQFLLINLDEFNAISPKVQEGFLKNVIQLANVKVKRPYGKHVEVFPRLASFIATANMTDILADPSGSRRFIGVELTGPIRVSRSVNHQQLYAQAYNAIMKGEQYWFDATQTALIMESNRQFQMLQPIEQLFFDTFEIVSDERQGEYLTATAIYSAIKKVAGSTVMNTNLRAFGRWLMNLEGLLHKGSNQGTKYLVKRL